MDTEAGGSREGVVTTLGRTFTPNDDGFDAARREAMWRTNVPNRYPDRIVQAIRSMTWLQPCDGPRVRVSV